jgi:competence ComEA-like helix-hairpin-helix protein
MFTRNELLILAFMAIFGLSGAILSRVRESKETAAVTVIPSAFEVPRQDASSTGEEADNKKTLKMGCEKININRAGIREMMKLPGVGETLAQRILKYRDRLGGFKSKSDLLKVRGIGKKKLEILGPLIDI